MRINSLLAAISLDVALSLVTGCTDPVEPATGREAAMIALPAPTCYNFSSFAGSFGVGDVVNTADATISFHQFQWDNGMWTAGGVASVVASSFAAGTPVNELNLNNIMVRVTPDIPSTGASYRYADLGGNVNFGVNGDFRNVANLDALDGTVVGGCNISVTRTNFLGGHRGVVTIAPQAGVTIERFGVGGQEFYIDDVCH
jgi:hypothetical protein